jgi:hypothetical protein
MIKRINLHVARSNFIYIADDNLAVDRNSTRYQKFSDRSLSDRSITEADVVFPLKLEHARLDRNCSWSDCLVTGEIWELWLDENKNFVFYNPKQPLLRQVVISPDFSGGVIRGDFLDSNENDIPILPLTLELAVFVNLLAGYGDALLHASGVSFEGNGYVFIGNSGVGKSTLASTLSKIPGITVLGEDQVVLRYLNGQFWVFGSPWHTNLDMCSPQGVPLKKIFHLIRNGEDGVRSLSMAEGVVSLLSTAFVPYYRPSVVELILERFTQVAQSVDMYSFKYQLGTDVWGLIQSY